MKELHPEELAAQRARVAPPERWRHTPAALRAFIDRAGLSTERAGELVGVDSRTIRRWLDGSRAMPYSAWYTLVSRSRKA